ncbi:MAG: hypothetical protein HYS34_08105 [Acidobacteria bacterium]|nr:hypothetical protein [Acidobacteriota bacterium]
MKYKRSAGNFDGRAVLFELLIAAITLACSRQQAAGSPVQQHAGPSAPEIYPQGRLEVNADSGIAVVMIGGEPAITVEEFNARLREFPIRDEGQDAAAARKQVVDKMIDLKIIVREAARRRSSGGRESGPTLDYAEERGLAQEMVRTSVANPLLVSDDEAEKYYAEHKQMFQELDASGSSQEERMLFIKFTLLSKRFKEKVRSWRSQQTIEISEDLLKR